MNQDGYPTDEELDAIKGWTFEQPNSFKLFMEYIEGNCWSEYGRIKHRGRTYWFYTGGWSGNEEIIDTMQDNFIFWSVCWVSIKRGGAYKFLLPPKSYWKDGKP